MKTFAQLVLIVFIIAITIEFPIFSIVLFLLILLLSQISKMFKEIMFNLKSSCNEVMALFYKKSYRGFIYEINDTILYKDSLDDVLNRYNELKIGAKRQVAIGVVESITSSYNYDIGLSDMQYSNIQQFVKRFKLKRNGIVIHPSFEKLVKLFVINDLITGNMTDRIEIPMLYKLANFKDDEVMLWVFDKVQYSQTPFSKYSFANMNDKHDIKGILYFTDKYILFSSYIKNVKIYYRDIVDLKENDDELTINTKNNLTRRFKNLDVDFSRSIIMNIKG